jgi:hypothetical protein
MKIGGRSQEPEVSILLTPDSRLLSPQISGRSRRDRPHKRYDQSAPDPPFLVNAFISGKFDARGPNRPGAHADPCSGSLSDSQCAAPSAERILGAARNAGIAGTDRLHLGV